MSMVRTLARGIFVAVAVVLAASTDAAGQVTTGTVFGTVKDAQGGVVPGVSLVLTSETRGTKSAPVISSTSGDYVFPNVTADLYTLEATMNGFKSIKRTGLAVSPGDRL